MIRKLNEEDRVITLDFLSDEPAINLFIIGDIEAFGFDEDFQEVWGDFDNDGKLLAVLLRFNESFIPYYKDSNYDTKGFKRIITSFDGKAIISGKESIAKNFIDLLPNYKAKRTYFCELVDSSCLSLPNDESIKIATENDAERVYNLIDQIEEFGGIANAVDRIKHKLNTRTGRIYYIEDEKGEMISIVQTTAENSKSAMIVGVATLENHRNKGYVSKSLSKLCNDVLLEGKTLCLFYDNPKAGSIYHRLGFKSIDNWLMISEDKDN